MVEHRLAGEEPADPEAVEASNQFAVQVALERVRPSETEQLTVGVDVRLADPAACSSLVRATDDRGAEVEVAVDLILSAFGKRIL